MTPIHRVSTFTSGVYAASRLMLEYRDRLAWPTSLRMVQLCHGVNAGPDQFTPGGSATTGTSGLLKALVESGRYLPFAADQGGTAGWGGSGIATDIEAANTWIANRDGARTDKFALIGYSMGFLNLAQEVYANPSKIPVVIGIAPVTDGTHVRADNVSFQAGMDTAAGGTWSTVDATRSPAQRTAAFSGIHVECWQGASDVTVRPADTATFCTGTGGTNHSITADHGSILTNVVAADVLAALDAGNWS